MTHHRALRRAGTSLGAVLLVWGASAGTAAAQEPPEELDPSTITDLLEADEGDDGGDGTPLDAILDPLSEALPLPGDDEDDADDGSFDGTGDAFGEDADDGADAFAEDDDAVPTGGVDAGFGGLAEAGATGATTGLAAALLAGVSAAWLASARRAVVNTSR